MINTIYNEAKSKMDDTMKHVYHELSLIRTGRASSSILDNLKVDYYGTPTPIKGLAHISVPDHQLIVIQAFDPNSLELIEKAILQSDIGLTPNNDGSVLRLNVPSLTEERRLEFIKLISNIVEQGRVSIRNIRRDTNDQIKKLESSSDISEDNMKRGLDNVQELTNEYIELLAKTQASKEKDIKEN